MTEPWIIICETCQSKLRVRSAEAIGSILACPKCGSFVHVVAPEAPAEPAAPLSATPNEAHADGGKSASARFALASGGVVLAVAIGFVLVQRSGREAASAAAGPVPIAEHEATTDRPQPADGPTEETPVRDASDRPPPEENPAEHLLDEQAEAADNRPSGTPATNTPPALPELPAEADAVAISSRPAATPEPATRRDVPRIGLAQFDLSFEPGQQVSADVRGPALPRVVPQSDADTEMPADVSPVEPPASSIVRMAIERMDTGGPPVAGDPAAALSLPLDDMTIGGTNETSPLQVVRLVADLTGATITFRPEAYVAVRKVPSAFGPVQYTRTTAGEILRDYLQKHGLHVAERGRHLVVLPLADGGPKQSALRPRDAIVGSGPTSGKLRQHITFSFTQGAELSEVLKHLERSAGLTVLVDWESLASLGLSPGSRVTASVLDQPLVDVLDGLLPQLEMDWAVAEDALWLTARRQGS